jgi:hypothetical protein
MGRLFTWRSLICAQGMHPLVCIHPRISPSQIAAIKRDMGTLLISYSFAPKASGLVILLRWRSDFTVLALRANERGLSRGSARCRTKIETLLYHHECDFLEFPYNVVPAKQVTFCYCHRQVNLPFLLQCSLFGICLIACVRVGWVWLLNFSHCIFCCN